MRWLALLLLAGCGPVPPFPVVPDGECQWIDTCSQRRGLVACLEESPTTARWMRENGGQRGWMLARDSYLLQRKGKR